MSKIVPNDVQVKDLMAFIYYGRVISKNVKPNGETEIDIENVDNKDKFTVKGNSLISEALSADMFLSTEKSTKTQIAEMLTTSYNKPFTVCFTKVDGTTRVLRGRLVKPEPLMGRSSVEDLDITNGSPLRLVDHRNIQYLIVDGVKYITK